MKVKKKKYTVDEEQPEMILVFVNVRRLARDERELVGKVKRVFVRHSPNQRERCICHDDHLVDAAGWRGDTDVRRRLDCPDLSYYGKKEWRSTRYHCFKARENEV